MKMFILTAADDDAMVVCYKFTFIFKEPKEEGYTAAKSAEEGTMAKRDSQSWGKYIISSQCTAVVLPSERGGQYHIVGLQSIL